MNRLDALESITWSEYHFDGHTTGRNIPKKLRKNYKGFKK